jgi:hypothetical protein
MDKMDHLMAEKSEKIIKTAEGTIYAKERKIKLKSEI